MESKVHTYTNVRNAIHRMLEGSDVARGSSTEHSMCILEQKWTTVYAKMQERKVSVKAMKAASSQPKQQGRGSQDVLLRDTWCTPVVTK